jgi:hypothetical protein
MTPNKSVQNNAEYAGSFRLSPVGLDVIVFPFSLGACLTSGR